MSFPTHLTCLLCYAYTHVTRLLITGFIMFLAAAVFKYIKLGARGVEVIPGIELMRRVAAACCGSKVCEHCAT